jgi:hypothetical protein
MDSKRCPEGKEVNPKTGRCINKCADGTVRNDKGRCVKDKTKKASSQKARTPSPAKAQTPPPASKKKCPEGKEVSTKTGRCINICLEGTVRNPATGRCIKDKTKKARSPSPAKARTPSPAKARSKVCPSDEIPEVPKCFQSSSEYRKMTLKFHPDKNKDCRESAAEKFKNLANNKDDQLRLSSDGDFESSFGICTRINARGTSRKR